MSATERSIKQLFVKMAQRYEPAETWNLINPILAPGEIGIVSETGNFKIGNGLRQWKDLPLQYATGIQCLFFDSMKELPPAKDYPGMIAIVPREYREEDENGEQIIVKMDTPYLSLRKKGQYTWVIFADQNNKPLTDSTLGNFILGTSPLA